MASTAPVRIGRVGRAHGLQGTVSIDDCPLSLDELKALGDVTWRGRDGAERTLRIESAREAHTRYLVRFEGFRHRDTARVLTLGELYVDSARLPDPGPGTAYAFQLIGLAVETDDGRRLGVLESILPTGAHPVYIVRGEREWLIPANDQVLRKVDLTAGVITVTLPAGLEDL